MAKKQGRYEPIDEDVIRNLIGGVDAPPRLVPKPAPAAEPPETPPPESPADASPTEVERVAATAVPTSRTRKTEASDYERFFLQSRKCQARMICRLERDLWQKLNLVVQLLGNGKLTVPGLVNNIVQHHIATYREEINKMIKNTTNNL